MTNYSDKAALAERLLEKFGQSGAIRRVTRTGGGPSDTTGGTETSKDHSCKLVVLPVDQQAVDGTTIQTGDWRVIVSALEIEPTTSDQIVCSEGVLQIITPGKLAPAGVVVLYDMIGRG